MSIVPSTQQMSEFCDSDIEGPIVMCNLLKFRDADEYLAYGEAATAALERVGARILWTGTVRHVLVGDAAEAWDAVVLVAYPSRQAFLDMISSSDYQTSHAHRERGLAKTALLCCVPDIDLLGSAQPLGG